MDGQHNELVGDESCAERSAVLIVTTSLRFQFLNTLHRLIYFTVVCSGANFLIQEMDFFHTSFAVCSNFFFFKMQSKIGVRIIHG